MDSLGAAPAPVLAGDASVGVAQAGGDHGPGPEVVVAEGYGSRFVHVVQVHRDPDIVVVPVGIFRPERQREGCLGLESSPRRWRRLSVRFRVDGEGAVPGVGVADWVSVGVLGGQGRSHGVPAGEFSSTASMAVSSRTPAGRSSRGWRWLLGPSGRLRRCRRRWRRLGAGVRCRRFPGCSWPRLRRRCRPSGLLPAVAIASAGFPRRRRDRTAWP